ncbi:hypothetical protein [Streptomyces sp. NPDC090798]|uniref:hypothetical protein n=1 Tax=Streptomyces sp. NPDC090798 TaxID=3365968 RepID=UPI0037F45C71
MRRLLISLFAEAAAPTGVEPAEAADICLALVVGLESSPGGRHLLAPATDALLTGLLGGRGLTCGGSPVGPCGTARPKSGRCPVSV